MSQAEKHNKSTAINMLKSFFIVITPFYSLYHTAKTISEFSLTYVLFSLNVNEITVGLVYDLIEREGLIILCKNALDLR